MRPHCLHTGFCPRMDGVHIARELFDIRIRVRDKISSARKKSRRTNVRERKVVLKNFTNNPY